jgi:hypothetical protein
MPKYCSPVCAHYISNRKPANMAMQRRKNKNQPADIKKIYQQRYRDKHPGRIEDYRLRKTYGISLAQFNEMVDGQGGRCAICGIRPVRLHIDHDHVGGAIRGLLCINCNMALGLLRDDQSVLLEAVSYLRRGKEPHAISG